MNASPPDQELVERTICELNRALRSHGGGVEQVGDVQDGVLRLRMTGLCAGCLYRPLTTIGTLKPFIAERLGIDVEVAGARISDEAQRRVLAALSRSYEGPGS
ncbi:NifU family protein [Mycobacterium avium]|jgi:Fe-S cluster biogenesis protein NfuA|uniref:NifU family protein n=1 Tax=Mycobacterium avium TaxID=1764 RepID=UPI0007A0BE4E|nr:NifU family protein [Mycobacterium avium]MDV3290058.1 NifU family protein [Mycobacterium avium subsp. hominissuis]